MTGEARLSFVVYGRPEPGGSKRAFPIRRKAGGGWVATGRIAVVDDNPRVKTWQGEVATAGANAMMRAAGPARGAEYDPAPDLWEGALGLSVRFFMRRPKGHYGSGRNAKRIKDSAPMFPTSKPDATKLLRAVEDALSGVVWRDDAQIVEQSVSKVYGHPEGAHVVVWKL